jgi:uncharacterized protein (TIGR01777 family)
LVVTVVSRQEFKPAALPAKINFASWDGTTVAGWGHLVEEAEAIVNLAGAGLAAARWSDARKKALIDSRVNPGKAIVEAVRAAHNKPKVLIQASAVGYYGTDKKATFVESSQPGDDFLANLCRQWEASTEAVEEMGVRRVIIRTGVVLDMKGMAFPKMVLPFQFFAGGPIGSGRQWFPWIHYLDEVEAIRFLLQEETIEGAVNLTAPNPLRNFSFARAMGQAMKRPYFTWVPGFVFKIIFGEMSTILLDGQQVVPGRLEDAGFQFKFPTAEAALQDLLGSG